LEGKQIEKKTQNLTPKIARGTEQNMKILMSTISFFFPLSPPLDLDRGCL
jgi:hypothetical protein